MGEYLQYIQLCTSKLKFDSNFRIPPTADDVRLETNFLFFESLDFMYHLPTSLTRLRLVADEHGQMSTLTQVVKWPLMLGAITFQNFNIDYSTLELLNLKESRLEEISISGGDNETLDVDLCPVSVKNISLTNMRIRELPASFEKLENLRELCLAKNQLRKVNSVKLPISSLVTLILCQCDLRLVSPFLVSMSEEKNRNAKLRLDATENSGISVIDVGRAMTSMKGLLLDVDNIDESLVDISEYSNRLSCTSRMSDSDSEKSGTEGVVTDYDTDDLYNGRVFIFLNEDSDDEDDVEDVDDTDH